jgi:hypothetical protein
MHGARGALAAEKAQHILAAEVFQRVVEETRVERRQFGRRVEEHIGRVLALLERPVVRLAHGRADLRGQRMTLCEQALQQLRPIGLQLLIAQPLRRRHVGKVGKAVALLHKAEACFLELLRQPLAAIETDGHGERKPSLQPQVEQPVARVQEVEVEVEALALPGLKHELPVPRIALHAKGAARLHATVDADQALLPAAPEHGLLREQLLALGAARQVLHLQPGGRGQPPRVLPHARGQLLRVVAELFEQHAGAMEITRHPARVLQRAKAPHEAHPIKSAQNPAAMLPKTCEKAFGSAVQSVSGCFHHQLHRIRMALPPFGCPATPR